MVAHKTLVNRPAAATRRGGTFKRLVPLLVVAAIGVGLFRQGQGLDWRGTLHQLGQASLALVFLALGVFYAGFLLRCLRWCVLLANAGIARARAGSMPSYAGLVGIMYRAWFVNTVTVAQAGDAYRGFLLKRRAGAPLPATVGTIVVERLVDVSVLAALLPPAIVLAFDRHLPADIRWILIAAAVVSLAGSLALVALRRVEPFAAHRLPARVAAPICHFSRATVASLRRIPLLIVLSAGGWLGECLMLALVARALGVPLAPAQAATVALITALLTILPVTPGGLGVADVGMLLLLGYFGVAAPSAAAITLLTRAISVGSVVAGGGLLCLISCWNERRAPRLILEGSRVMELTQSAGPLAARVRVDVVVPVYNEAAALPRSIPTLCGYLAAHCPLDWRVVIADNASTDRTLAIARALAAAEPHVAVLHLDQKGRGRALRAAWLASQADVVAYMDVDLSTDLRAFLPLVKPLVAGDADVAVGSRLRTGAVVTRQWKRELLSRGYNRLIRLLFRNRFSDAQCGFKALTREAARALLPLVEDQAWFFDTELLLLAEARGLRVHEVPVAWVEDRDSRVNLTATVAEDLRGLWRLRRRLRGRSCQPIPAASGAGVRGS